MLGTYRIRDIFPDAASILPHYDVIDQREKGLQGSTVPAVGATISYSAKTIVSSEPRGRFQRLLNVGEERPD